MALDSKRHIHKQANMLRDIRPLRVRIVDTMSKPAMAATMFFTAALMMFMNPWVLDFADVVMFVALIYFLFLKGMDRSLPFKMPFGSKYRDKNGKNGKGEGILYLGNIDKTKEEIWFTNSDARTHILYLGTTGSGKTVGLTSMAANALSWGSGFVYVDGKADTDLWSALSALVRRFGRDDDLLVLNYMTGNSDVKAPSNTMNPFSSGSASYLTNMLVSLMPESEGDNAMWKERAVSLASAMMPILTWKRDHQDMPMSVRTIRDNLSLNNVVKLSRDQAVPEILRGGIKGYLDTLPGFVGDAYDDNGAVKPPGPGGPPPDTTTANQQHGYLAMQFTRALQSLGDDYGYIFDTQAADVDMVDVVLNRRVLIVLIPALEKSGDEIANVGKIVASTMKGMMGSALGATVEGSQATVVDNKAATSSTPFMTVFDEVGYYTAQGMAVMAAQARSLGFCLIFSGQDIPAMKKRVREEANSILANCNIKIFGKLEDPTDTKDFFEKTVGKAYVTEVSGFQAGTGSRNYFDTKQASIQIRDRASYDGLRGFTEGQAIIAFGEVVADARMFYSNPGHAKAMRVTRYMALPPPDEEVIKHAASITKLRDLMVNKTWTAMGSAPAIATPDEIEALNKGYRTAMRAKVDPVEAGISALVEVHALNNPLGAVKAEDQVEAAPRRVDPPVSSAPAAPVAPSAPVTTASTLLPLGKTLASPTSAPVDPMGFFKAPGSTPSPIAQESPKETPEPASAPPQQTQATQPVLPARPKLPKEIQDIIDGAAQSAKKALIKDGDKE